jgi:hypothetical protein
MNRTEPKQDERVANQPVFQARLRGQRGVLAHGQRVDVTMAAPIEIAGRGVMQCVIVAPLTEWGQREHPGDPSDDAIRALPWQKRAVRAVMHDDERPDEQTGGRER